MDVRVGDILLMKKKHPCGGEEFTVTRVGYRPLPGLDEGI